MTVPTTERRGTGLPGEALVGSRPSEIALASERLSELEAVIERGLTTFLEVGQALMEVRDAKLYKAEYATFDAYLRDRWGMERTYAHRTIEASKVVAALPVGNSPQSEAQARELAKAEDPAATWAAAQGAHGLQPTAKQIKDSIAQPSNGRRSKHVNGAEMVRSVDAVSDVRRVKVVDIEIAVARVIKANEQRYKACETGDLGREGRAEERLWGAIDALAVATRPLLTLPPAESVMRKKSDLLRRARKAQSELMEFIAALESQA